MRILVNHLGYDSRGPKRAVVQERGETGGASAAARTEGSESESSTASAEPGLEPRRLYFEVREVISGTLGAAGSCDYRGVPDRWRQGCFWEIEFSGLSTPGTYRIAVYGSDESGRRSGEAGEATEAESAPFEVAPDLIFRHTFCDLLFWFKGQRSSGAEDRTDRAASLYGDRSETVDLRGGWFDASGDTSKYLSHLSYANYLNPQQTPGVVWAMLAARELLVPTRPGAPALWERRLLDEIAWGADFLLRMQDPAGYFYLTLFDQWSKDLENRVVSSFRGQDGERGEDYQAGYRQGGGMAIAALARAGALGLALSRDADTTAPAPGHLPGAPGRGNKPPETLLPGEYAATDYLAAAARGFEHLEKHNRDYLDDGEENIIDDYCALLAATELCLAAGQGATEGRGAAHSGAAHSPAAHSGAARSPAARSPAAVGLGEPGRYLQVARRRADSLRARLATDGEGRRYWRAGAGERPYYHAAEAGLPVMALLRYAECEALLGEKAPRTRALQAAAEAMAAELAVTVEVANPFGYARQHVAEPGGPKRTSFFIPHNNESGYWWQGENGRVASLAAAAMMQAITAGEEGSAEEDSAGKEFGAGRSEAAHGSLRAPKAGDGGVERHPPQAGMEDLRRYAADQINWILGLNPFDICMLDGVGRNNPEYEAAYPNAPGGICNGITGGVEDEGDIAFLPEPWGGDPLHRWRWSEQWIPHAGWFLLAISAHRRGLP